MSALARYIEKLRTTEHPDDMKEVAQLVLLALESPSVFFAQFESENRLHEDAAFIAIDILDTLNVPEQVNYLKLRGIVGRASVRT